jgi:hypothetical protein
MRRRHERRIGVMLVEAKGWERHDTHVWPVRLIVRWSEREVPWIKVAESPNTRKVCCEPALRRMTCSCKEWYKHYRNSGR